MIVRQRDVAANRVMGRRSGRDGSVHRVAQPWKTLSPRAIIAGVIWPSAVVAPGVVVVGGDVVGGVWVAALVSAARDVSE